MKNINERVSLENQKVRGTPNKARRIALIAAGVLAVGWGVAFAPDIKDEIEFRQAYNQALSQYGDINGDGFVSKEENRELFDNIFYKSGITFNSEGGLREARYSTGKEVPINELTKRIRKYIEHPFPLR